MEPKIFTRVLTREEQLEKVFPTILRAMFAEYIMVHEPDKLIEKYTKILLREVKSRVYLK